MFFFSSYSDHSLYPIVCCHLMVGYSPVQTSAGHGGNKVPRWTDQARKNLCSQFVIFPSSTLCLICVTLMTARLCSCLRSSLHSRARKQIKPKYSAECFQRDCFSVFVLLWLVTLIFTSFAFVRSVIAGFCVSVPAECRASSSPGRSRSFSSISSIIMAMLCDGVVGRIAVLCNGW